MQQTRKEVDELKRITPAFCANCDDLFIERRDNRFSAEYGSESGIYGSIDLVAVCLVDKDDCPDNVRNCPKVSKMNLPDMCLKCVNLLTECEPWERDRDIQEICRVEMLQGENSGEAIVTPKAS